MDNRRDVASRGNQIFHKLSRFLIKLGLTPNMVSVLSAVFALVASFGFYLAGHNQVIIGLSLILIGVQLRLVCNLIDGLMAVEGGLSSPQGEIFNDVPDRFSDWFIILPIGFIAINQSPYAWEICWTATVFAILTAYIRVLGASMGAGHNFKGPMAKQHRMAVVNLAVFLSFIEHLFFNEYYGVSFLFLVTVIAIGSAATCFKRLLWTYKKLEIDNN